MNDVTPFTYGDHSVRTLTIDGEPWFVLADLCKVLGINNGRMVADRLAADMKGVSQIDTLGGRQSVTIVSEPGMYEVVIRSDKPEAAAFRRWITTEVLPSIRKTGSYSTVPALTEDEIVHQALQITAAKVAALTATVEHQTARLRLVEPKAAAFDRWLSSNVDYAVGDVAKALANAGVPDMGRTRLFRELHKLNWIYRDGRSWAPYQRQIETKRLTVKLGTQLNTRTGDEFGTTTVRITPKGATKLAAIHGVMSEAVMDALAEVDEAAA